jgi:hypothetical protein
LQRTVRNYENGYSNAIFLAQEKSNATGRVGKETGDLALRANTCPQGLGSAPTVDINSTRVAALMRVELGAKMLATGMVIHDTVIVAWFAPLTLAGDRYRH